MRTAVIGLGYMGQNHARVLSGLEGVQLSAVCDKDDAKAETIAKKYKVKNYKRFPDLLSSEKLDAVFICLPTSLHFDSAMLALKRGLPVFIEKPIAANSSQAKKLESYSRRKKIPLMVGHIERFNPVITEIRNRLNSGELGKIIHIHTQRFSPPPTRAQDVSAIVDLATHDIDIINFLVGQLPIRIYAETETKYHKKEDLMSAVFRYRSGVIGLVEVSWLHPTKIRSLTILGQHGMYSANYLTQELLFYKQSESVAKKKTIPSPSQTWADIVKIAFEAKEPLSIEIKAFINAVKNNIKVPVSAKEGLEALLVTEKIIKSGSKKTLIK